VIDLEGSFGNPASRGSTGMGGRIQDRASWAHPVRRCRGVSVDAHANAPEARVRPRKPRRVAGPNASTASGAQRGFCVLREKTRRSRKPCASACAPEPQRIVLASARMHGSGRGFRGGMRTSKLACDIAILPPPIQGHEQIVLGSLASKSSGEVSDPQCRDLHASTKQSSSTGLSSSGRHCRRPPVGQTAESQGSTGHALGDSSRNAVDSWQRREDRDRWADAGRPRELTGYSRDKGTSV